MEVRNFQDKIFIHTTNSCICELVFIGLEMILCQILDKSFNREDLAVFLKKKYAGFFIAFFEQNASVNAQFEPYFKKHAMHVSMRLSNRTGLKVQIDNNFIGVDKWIYQHTDNLQNEMILCLYEAFGNKEAVEKWIQDYSRIEYDKKNYALSLIDGRVVSCLLTTKTINNDIYIFLSGTIPQYQKNGCFKFLFTQLARDNPETDFTLGAFTNEIAYKVYLNLGFEFKYINSFKL